MKKKLLLIFMLFITVIAYTQTKTNVYWTTGGELIFSWGQMEYTDQFKLDNQDAEIVDNPVRFTCFFHVGQNIHLDFSNRFGMYSGFGIRNIGMISDEVLPDITSSTGTFDTKIIRRSYTVGIPLAFKLGSFDDNFFIFGGGEIEWAFLMKEKYWKEHSRDGNKTKEVDWFASDRINPFLPSVFAGIQFPGGVNLKFKYYLTDFLNHNYKGNGTGNDLTVSNLSKYKSSQLVYVSLSFNTPNSEIKKSITYDKVAMAY